MNKQWIGVLLAAALSACGGGGSDDGGVPLDTTGADVPASLTSPTEAAMSAAALMDFISLSGGFGIQSTSGKAAAKDTSPPCDSGSKSFVPDSSTVYAQDGQTSFSDCTQTSGSTQFVEDGVLTTRCTDDNQSASQCAKQATFSGKDHIPLRFEQIGPGSDQRILAFGQGIESTSGDEYANGTQQYDNLVNGKSATLVFDQMFLFASAASGTRTARVGGGFGLNDAARATANCISGKLTVSTPQEEPLTINENEDVIGGHLHFASDDGSFADVFFQSDNTWRASVNGGTPQTFSFSQFHQFCSIH